MTSHTFDGRMVIVRVRVEATSSRMPFSMKILTRLYIVVWFVVFSNATHKGFFSILPSNIIAGENMSMCVTLTDSWPKLSVVHVIMNLKIRGQYYQFNETFHSDAACFNLTAPTINIRDYTNVNVEVQVQVNDDPWMTAHNLDPIKMIPSLPVYFIETDRLLYRSGEVVKIRIIALNRTTLLVEKQKVFTITIKNPLDVIVSLENATSEKYGIVQLEHQLGENSLLGNWKVECNGQYREFEVTKNLSPRFAVKLFHPKSIYLEQQIINLVVCAEYSYGRPVEGNVLVYLMDSQEFIHPFQYLKKANSSGCADFHIRNDELSLGIIKRQMAFQNDSKVFLHVSATFTEHTTDIVEIANGKIVLHTNPYELRFDRSLNVFMPGLPYRGRLSLTNAHIEVLEHVIEICYHLAIRKSWNFLPKENCSNFTMISAQSAFTFYVPPLRNQVIHLHLNARSLNYTSIYDSALVVRLYSPSNSYIQMNTVKSKACDKSQKFSVLFTTDKLLDSSVITFYYLVRTRHLINGFGRVYHKVSKAGFRQQQIYEHILGSKHIFIRNTTLLCDNFMFEIKLSDLIVSKYMVILYYILSSGEIVATTTDVQSEACFIHKINTNWNRKQILPGSTVALNINASSESICAVSVVDRSTTFAGGEKNMVNQKEIIHSLFDVNANTATPSFRKACLNPVKKSSRSEHREKRYVYSFSEEYDAYDTLMKFGAVTITNLKIINKFCYSGPPSTTSNSDVQFLTDHYNVYNDESFVPIRSYFPDTWLWDIVPVRKGTNIIRRNSPHSVTSWTTRVMCVSPSEGIGFSPTTELVAFQPFFVDIVVPATIKRTEIFYLNVLLFNYLNYSLPMKLSLSESNGLMLHRIQNKRSVSFCVPAVFSISHIFQIEALKVGNAHVTVMAEIDANYPGHCGPDVILDRRDVVFKRIHVEPEGYRVRMTQSAFLCANDRQLDNYTFESVKSSAKIVPNTEVKTLLLSGDLMGASIENIGHIITLPIGCGEQIMSSLAPNIFALNYLNATHRLSSTIRQKARRHTKIGYQKILNYLRKDGSFSAFGLHDPHGSMFLTAFVVKTLSLASEYVYVDKRIIERAVKWILTKQMENGCFASVHHVFQDMGESNAASLTAYVILSLLDSKIDVPDKIISNAKYCIRGQYDLDQYTLAISAYALFRIKWFNEANRMLQKLQKISQHHKNMVWWTSRDEHKSEASSIEISSYVLLALLEFKTNENLATAHAVVRWLSTKFGPKGQFKSTQDTVVAMEALTRYAVLVNAQVTNLNISVVNEKSKQQFHLDPYNKLEAMHYNIQNLDANVQIFMNGQGCVLAQVIQAYNIKHSPMTQAFTLAIDVRPASTIQRCAVLRISPCFVYSGPHTGVNMAVLDLEVPTGYYADRMSLYKLIETDTNVHYFEYENTNVILYLTKLNKGQICVNIDIQEYVSIKSRTDSIVRLYDYYNPEFEAVQFLQLEYLCKPVQENDTIPEIIRTNSTIKIEHNILENQTSITRYN